MKSDIRLMALDLETTSADPEEARIVSASILFRGGGLPASDSDWLINPGIPIPPDATKVHGITDEMAREGQNPSDVLPLIAGDVEAASLLGVPVVIYNAVYDLTVIDRECRRHGGRLNLRPQMIGPGGPLMVIDPFVIDKALDPYRMGSRKLVDVAANYGVKSEGAAHGAHADALMACRLAVRLLRNLPADTTLPMLHELQVGWHANQAKSLEDYFTRQGKPERVPREWPILPRA